MFYTYWLLFLFFLVCWVLSWFTFFFFTKISSFIKRGIRFQTPGCTFVTKFCVSLWKPLLCSLLLACCHLSIDRHSNILWKMWVQSAASKPSVSAYFSSNVKGFKIRNQLLGQIAVIYHDFCILCQTKLSTSHFIFYGKIASQPISYAANMFVAIMLVAKISTAEIFTAKIPDVSQIQSMPCDHQNLC